MENSHGTTVYRQQAFFKQMRNIVVLTFYTVVTYNVVGEAPDWCSFDCVLHTGKVEKNTMCVYKHQTSTRTCRDIRSSLTPDKRKEILHLHNMFRNDMAGGKRKGWPGAANMRHLSWDSMLEIVAQRWAEQCKPDHDGCRRTPEFEKVGQNYGMLATPDANPESTKGSFEGWISGEAKANASLIFRYERGDWGKFTQVIWANTFKLGCSQVQFSEKENGIDWKRTVIVCNYGPAGNMVTGRIYVNGKPCSQCPGGTSCQSSGSYPYLCASVQEAPDPEPITVTSMRSGSTLEKFIIPTLCLVCVLILFISS